ncbi:MAG: Rrf2 family transcriptional regulator [Candidatus Aminicenantes bacterium]|nr:Rrf2 family transcriptional regulator [Candidatus Aminicenantes bacterium]
MSKVFKFSDSASLAVHAMLLLAENKEQIFSNKQIATAIGASNNHLAKVLLTLSKRGLVRAVRGPAGGFTLNIDPNELSIYDVYTCVEPDFSDIKCFFNIPKCDGRFCILGPFSRTIVKKVTEKMKNTKLSDLNISSKFRPDGE